MANSPADIIEVVSNPELQIILIQIRVFCDFTSFIDKPRAAKNKSFNILSLSELEPVKLSESGLCNIVSSPFPFDPKRIE